MNEENLETATSLSADLSTRENITVQLEELLVAGNYDEAKLLLELLNLLILQMLLEAFH
tara:strand:- start:191 stop:367 length:177 start_codon:yes stop_codon:yes gene_type:complete